MRPGSPRPGEEPRSITITDTTGTSGSITVNDASDIPAALRPWFPSAPAEIINAIDDLADELDSRHPRTGDLATYLGVDITRD